MDGAGTEAVEDTVLAEHHILDDIVVRKHREDRIAPTGVRDHCDLLYPLPHQGFRFRPRAVVVGDLMARLQQIRRHACAHAAKPDETDLHDPAPSNASDWFAPLSAREGPVLGLQQLRVDRQRAYPLAGRGVDGVADRRHGRRYPGLADTGPWRVAVAEVDTRIVCDI